MRAFSSSSSETRRLKRSLCEANIEIMSVSEFGVVVLIEDDASSAMDGVDVVRFAKSSSKTEIVSDACINFVSAATALSTATSFSLFALSCARFATAISAANLLFLSRTAISAFPLPSLSSPSPFSFVSSLLLIVTASATSPSSESTSACKILTRSLNSSTTFAPHISALLCSFISSLFVSSNFNFVSVNCFVKLATFFSASFATVTEVFSISSTSSANFAIMRSFTSNFSSSAATPSSGRLLLLVLIIASPPPLLVFVLFANSCSRFCNFSTSSFKFSRSFANVDFISISLFSKSKMRL